MPSFSLNPLPVIKAGRPRPVLPQPLMEALFLHQPFQPPPPDPYSEIARVLHANRFPPPESTERSRLAADAAHQRKTRWTLLRGLLREVKSYGRVREYIIGQFKKDRRGLYASMYNRDQKEDDRLVHGRLAEAYELLEALKRNRSHPEYLQLLSARIKRLAHFKELKKFQKLIVEVDRTLGPPMNGNPKRGILTGEVLQASKVNPPLAMMVPMPHNVSMTINRRKKQLDAALLFITTVQEAKRKPDDKRLQAQIDVPNFHGVLAAARKVVQAAHAREKIPISPSLTLKLARAQLLRDDYRRYRADIRRARIGLPKVETEEWLQAYLAKKEEGRKTAASVEERAEEKAWKAKRTGKAGQAWEELKKMGYRVEGGKERRAWMKVLDRSDWDSHQEIKEKDEGETIPRRLRVSEIDDDLPPSA